MVLLRVCISVAMLVAVASAKNRVMGWMCLEFCDQDSSDAEGMLQQLEMHPGIFSAVSFEKYTLGPNVTLVDNNLTEVNNHFTSHFVIHSGRYLRPFRHLDLKPGHFSARIRTLQSLSIG